MSVLLVMSAAALLHLLSDFNTCSILNTDAHAGIKACACSGPAVSEEAAEEKAKLGEKHKMTSRQEEGKNQDKEK